jgi:hypothetical protein
LSAAHRKSDARRVWDTDGDTQRFKMFGVYKEFAAWAQEEQAVVQGSIIPHCPRGKAKDLGEGDRL